MYGILKAAAEALNYTRELLIVGLILCRVMPIVVLTPFLGGKLVPPEVKMGLGILFTIVLWPLARVTITGEIPTHAIFFLVLMMKEVFVGFAIGFVVAHIFWAMEMAGRVIDIVRGSSMAEVLVPESETRATEFGSLFFQILVVFIFVLGGHHLFFEALFYSFAEIPLDKGIAVGPSFGSFVDFAIRLTGEIIMISVILAAPVLAATFISDVVFGILNRVAPQLNAYFMSMPVKSMAGVIVVLIALQPLVLRLREYVVWTIERVEQTITLLSPL